MRFSSKAIQDFKAIWKAEFGEELSDADAEMHAGEVLRLFRVILRPIPHKHRHNPQPQEDVNFDSSAQPRTMEEQST